MANRFQGPTTNRFAGPSQDPVEAYNELPWYAQAGQAADDTVRFLANGMTFGMADRFAGMMNGEGTDAERARTEEAMARAGTAGTAANIVGGVMTGSALPSIGRGLSGSVGTGALYGGIDGALRDSDSWGEWAGNTIGGAGMGAGFGAGAHGVVSGIGKAGEVWRGYKQSPENRAIMQIGKAADDRFGAYNAHTMDHRVNNLGPEAARVDALGERGYGMARQSANINPEARETITDFAVNRRADQNVRLTRDVQFAGGTSGSTASVDQMRRAAYEQARPAIGAAYNEARVMGSEIPFSAFDDILTHPAVTDALDKARENVAYRERMGQPGGNLAVLDETKRLLDSHASNYSDPNRGIYAELAEGLRTRTDQLLMGPEYATARGLREDAFRADESFDLGARLGQRNVPIEVPAAAGNVRPHHQQNMAAAYAQTKAGRLLNNNNTAGALTEFVTPQGRRASAAALGPRGPGFNQAVDREAIYGRLNNALGNSTTARQLIEAGDMGQGAGALSYGIGMDPVTAVGIGGITQLAQKFGPMLSKAIATKRQKETAEPLADLLIGRGSLPSLNPLRKNRLENFAEGLDPMTAAKALVLGLGPDTNQTYGGPR
jgi:hypothetical protein